jgi:hypothetical protein
MFVESRTMRPVEIVLGRGRGTKGERQGSEFDCGTLNACM